MYQIGGLFCIFALLVRQLDLQLGHLCGKGLALFLSYCFFSFALLDDYLSLRYYCFETKLAG